MDVNERITALRKSLNLTQQEFARRIGSSRDVIANIDGKRNPPSQIVLTAICREFNVSYAWLKDGSGDMLLPPDEDDAVNRLMLGDSDFAKFVFRALAKLPPEAWEMFRQFIENLKAEADAKKSDD